MISCHTTCAVFSEEFDHDRTPAGDTFLQADLNDGLARVFPEQRDWDTYRYPGLRHFEEVEFRPDPGVVPAGRRASTAPCCGTATRTCARRSSAATRPSRLAGGRLEMNGLASIYFVDYDRTRERTRRARVVVMGE